ncbi:alanine/glycine:cation symporter family protein [Thalassotalea aquiviva]|uniref:alanine/glycine:cation symporter family protein n=1 Tax=Thalassotalea aquiviva TaxID=3242415 RepID=UPI00352B41D6
MIETIVDTLNGFLWGSVLIYLLVFCGLWFTFKLAAIQFRHFPHMFSVMKHSRSTDKHGISSFQALCTTLAARVGTGNLMGVAVAISLGGPGAVFWMWVIAIIGMATAYAESTLGQLYKIEDENGHYRGGPAFYMQYGLNNKPMAVLFSICLLLGYGLVFSPVQANSITDAFNGSYGIDPIYSGMVLTVLTGIIVLGGLKKIASFAELVVPFMGLAYVLVALAVIAINITEVPAALANIVSSAFGLREAGSGMVGAAIMNGVKRGLYSNEAGMGSAPNAAAAATPYPNHPASQGYVQMLGVFVDTIVLCTCTALIILLSGIPLGQEFGIKLTQQALENQVGFWGGDFITLAIFFFAFTSMVANFAYAENSLSFLKLDNKIGRGCFITLFLAMIFFGSFASLGRLIAMADLAVALMTIVNVIAIIMLTKALIRVSKDYNKHIDEGEEPNFKVSQQEAKSMRLRPGIWSDK